MQAIWPTATMQMRWGGTDITVAAGDENMSRMPFYGCGAHNGCKLGNRPLVEVTVGMLTDPFHMCTWASQPRTSSTRIHGREYGGRPSG